MTTPQRIRFFFPYQGTILRDRTRLKSFLQKIFRWENRQLNGLNYIFCSDKELLKINQAYLGHNYYTDIVTFELSENPGIIQAEVYISVDRVRVNAKVLGVSFRSELHRVIFHGALHLCGYRDKTMAEKAEMRGMEDLYLSKYLN